MRERIREQLSRPTLTTAERIITFGGALSAMALLGAKLLGL
jgi:hypothetical protein